jgi:hypothetical protein
MSISLSIDIHIYPFLAILSNNRKSDIVNKLVVARAIEARERAEKEFQRFEEALVQGDRG